MMLMTSDDCYGSLLLFFVMNKGHSDLGVAERSQCLKVLQPNNLIQVGQIWFNLHNPVVFLSLIFIQFKLLLYFIFLPR